MAGIDLQITGLDALERNLAELAEADPILRAAGADLFQSGEKIMGVSKRLAPVRNRRGGTLRASGTTLPPVIEGEEAVVIIGYGGAADPYALAAHENPRTGKTGGRSPSGKKYSSWSEVGEWKFLESAYLAHVTGTFESLAEATRKDIERRLQRT